MEKANTGLKSDIMRRVGPIHWEPRRSPESFAKPETHGITTEIVEEIVEDQLYQTFRTGEAMNRRVSEMRTQEGIPEQ